MYQLMSRIALVSCLVAGCSSGGTSASLPLIVPPVRAATPAGFDGATARVMADVEAMLSATDFRDRFFDPAGGPTNVFQILTSIDNRLDEVNHDPGRPCLDQETMVYTLSPFGQVVPFAAQCYRTFDAGSGPPAFMQFGQHDGETDVFVTGGASRVAARIAADSQVDAWYGVGYTNDMCGTDGTFDGCSYAVTQIHADPTTHAFEMAVAGIGVGFCGIQIRSDGTSIYGRGSADMGMTCAEPASLCVSAADLTMPGACDAISTFTLPALGREAGAGAHEFGASSYPDMPNIVLDGTPTDSLGFGPTAPTPGVGDFDAK